MTPEGAPMAARLECPEMACWQALFDDSLPPEQSERYERHLESCPACQDRLDRAEECGDRIRMLVRQVAGSTAMPADPTLVQFLERLHEETVPDRPDVVAPADLDFLSPGNEPDVPGMLGEYEVLEVIGQGGMGV